MGKFKPLKFGLTVVIVAGTIIGILAIADTDDAIGLNFTPPELRIVGECFKSCVEPDPNVSNGGTIILTDPNDPNNTIEEEILLGGGIMVIEDPITGEKTVVISGTNDPADVFPAIECPEGQMFFDPDITDGIQGICWNVTFIDTNGQEFVTTSPKDSIACWLQVTTQVIGDGGILLTTSKGDIFKVNPSPVLSLVDLQTQASIEKGGFKVFPKIKCSTSDTGDINPEGTFGFFSFPSFDTKLRIQATELTVVVWSENPEGNLIDTFNAKLPVSRLDITDTSERTLGELTIASQDLLKFLPNGKYESTQNIVFEGKLVLNWNTGIPSVDSQAFTIPLLTTQRQNINGDVISVFNELLVQRDIGVDRNVENGNGGLEPCVFPKIRIGEFCIIQEPEDCPNGQEFIVGLGCVSEGNDPKIPIPDIFQLLITCIQSGDSTCLLNENFLGIYFFGLAGIIFIGAIAQTAGRKRVDDIYGIPPEGFVGG